MYCKQCLKSMNKFFLTKHRERERERERERDIYLYIYIYTMKLSLIFKILRQFILNMSYKLKFINRISTYLFTFRKLMLEQKIWLKNNWQIYLVSNKISYLGINLLMYTDQMRKSSLQHLQKNLSSEDSHVECFNSIYWRKV